MKLTDTELQTLHAAMDRIIPPDDYPGAWDAGAGDYLIRQLEGDLQHLGRMYQEGLAALEAESAARHNDAFINLTAEQQDALLRNVESGSVQTAWPVSPMQFFSHLVHHTAEGYYSDPGNGGNRDCISWEMIGFVDRNGNAEAGVL